MKLSSAAVILSTSCVFLGGSPPPDRGAAATYDYRCPSGYVLIGIGGRQGMWMDAAWGICGRVRSDGTLNSGDRRTTTRAGGSGGTAGGTVCSSGQALVGYKSNTDTHVNTISTILCSTWDPSRRLAASNSYSYGLFARRPGGSYSQAICPMGMVGDAIRGQAGTYLDRFSVRCVFAPYSNPPPYLLPLRTRDRPWIVRSCPQNRSGLCV